MDLPDASAGAHGTPVSMKRDEFNLTPLMHAVACGRVKVVRLLLKTPGVDPMAVSSRGNTALHFAYERGSHAILEMMFQFGFQAVKHERNGEGKKPDELRRS